MHQLQKHQDLHIKCFNKYYNMAKYIDTYGSSNIQFNAVETIFIPNSKKWGHGENINASDADLTDIANDNGGKLPTIVNAVDIDWNGAQLKNGSTVKATLNTTGEMLSILQTA